MFLYKIIMYKGKDIHVIDISASESRICIYEAYVLTSQILSSLVLKYVCVIGSHVFTGTMGFLLLRARLVSQLLYD